MIPLIIASKMELGWTWIMLPFNIIMHAILDHGKANLKTINLLFDQAAHLSQIAITWGVWAITCLDNRVVYLIGLGIALGIYAIQLIVEFIIDLKKTRL